MAHGGVTPNQAFTSDNNRGEGKFEIVKNEKERTRNNFNRVIEKHRKERTD